MNVLRGPIVNQRFEDNFKCYSMVFFNESKADAEHGGKSIIIMIIILASIAQSCYSLLYFVLVILPPSALERLGITQFAPV